VGRREESWAVGESLAAVKEKEMGRVGLKREKLRRVRLRGGFQTFELLIFKSTNIIQKPCKQK
jgi:hypothetical protein